MSRWLLPLAVLCALYTAATAACRCVDPTSCPEAVVSASPSGCTLPGGKPGVCCPTKEAPAAQRSVAAAAAPAAATAAARRPSSSRYLPFDFMESLLGGSHGSGGLAALPAGARSLLQKFPLDTADQHPIRRPSYFLQHRPSGAAAATDMMATSMAAQFTAVSSAPAAKPSGTTMLNSLNARSSASAQRGAETTLRTLSRALRGSSGGGRSPADRFPSSFGGLLTSRQRSQTAATCRPRRQLRCSDAGRHRTIDGTCNNLDRPHWGSRLQGLRRIFDSTFDDGVFAARSRSVSGGLLPSARLVSATVLSSESRPQSLYTMSVTTFGQFMDHDLSISPIFQLEQPDGTFKPIECCDDDGRRLPTRPKHPQCLPISVPANDPFYGRFGVRCMNLVRSIPVADPQCRSRPATQLNDLTSWMDLSQVYGNFEEQASELREHRGGRLRTSAGNLLPREVPNPGTNCTSRVCFIAGDERVNENTPLTLFHTVFLREHNRVAAALAARHGWSDERLYQEARRIVIAEWQHIAYHEWLPAIVGYGFARRTGLTGFGRFSYVPVLNPTVSTEFSTASFRLHSMVQGVIDLVTRVGTIRRQLQLTDNFFRPDSLVVSNIFTEMARGLTQQQPQSFDKRFERAIRGDLFKVGAFGLDLVSLNIQRGRDHGIPTYATVASRCNDIRISGWSSFRQLIPAGDVRRLMSVYNGHWQDVDLYVGMNMERKAPGALVGPTARCIIADQFLRSRYADRYFYDQAGQSGSFSSAQLAELRKASWARLLCDNVGPGFDAVQPLAFIKPINFFKLNPVVSCRSYRIKRVNLNRF